MRDLTGLLQPIDAIRMRRVNRAIILELIRQDSPIARSEISRTLQEDYVIRRLH